MKNKLEIRGKDAIVWVKRKNGDEYEVIIDREDLDKLEYLGLTWYASPRKTATYIFTTDGSQTIMLHRFITDAPPEKMVDHIDRNTLNNRKSNLRFVTAAQNTQNISSKNRKSISGIRGVYWDKRVKRWKAQVNVNKKAHRLGSFADIKDAEKVVVEFRKKHMKFSTEDRD